ncbi:MAG TPA: hypothetical protein C5S51_06920 [Methanosarcinaceae archaeon]|nr:hypothetical protein [Methanosarcinaceae archaeon]
MKDLIKNDDAVSVVVGAILILAVLVTFMSVVTSSWVPIYEGNAESAHSDDTHKAFMDIHKQIEMADEFAKSVSIDLGTNEMAFIQNSNSVGMLEVNESDGGLFVTGNITRQSNAWGEGFEIVNMNTSDTEPFMNISFEFTQLYNKQIGDGNHSLNNNFMVKIWTTELSRWITLYPIDIANSNFYSTRMGIRVSYDANPQREIWVGESSDLNSHTITVSHPNVSINLLTNDEIMKLIEPEILIINGTTYNASDTVNNTAPLNDVIQHYMRLPGDGTGGTYNIDYVQYDGILDATQYIAYKTTDESVSMIAGEGSNIKIMLDDFKVGGGTLKLQSDYNFMVDQSYIYDSGAVILSQDDGAVFKTAHLIVPKKNINGNLTLTLKSTVLEGEYQASGNGIETLYTALDGNVYEISGVTDNITIVKNTTPELYPLWKSYFSDLGKIVNTTSADFVDISNETINRVGININSTTPDITLTVQRKEIIIS